MNIISGNFKSSYLLHQFKTVTQCLKECAQISYQENGSEIV